MHWIFEYHSRKLPFLHQEDVLRKLLKSAIPIPPTGPHTHFSLWLSTSSTHAFILTTYPLPTSIPTFIKVPCTCPSPTSLMNSFSSFPCAWIPKPFHLACAWNPSIYHPSPPCPCKPMIPTSIPTFHKVPCTRTVYHLCHHHASYLHIHSFHTHQNFSHPFLTLPVILSKTTSVYHLSYLPHLSFATKPLTPHSPSNYTPTPTSLSKPLSHPYPFS